MSFAESVRKFYPHYLKQHEHPYNRVLHFIGTSLVILTLTYLVLTGAPAFNYLLLPLIGYGFAWNGHFWFEGLPATFNDPLKSLVCDFVMWADIARGNLELMPPVPQKKK